eukprot:15431020-Alexandrium_andersonii.AAC.1
MAQSASFGSFGDQIRGCSRARAVRALNALKPICIFRVPRAPHMLQASRLPRTGAVPHAAS